MDEESAAAAAEKVRPPISDVSFTLVTAFLGRCNPCESWLPYLP